MSKTLYALLVLALLLPFASAEDVFREPAARTDSDAFLLNFPYWAEVNATSTLYVTQAHAGTSYATLRLGNSSANMTYVSSIPAYRAFVSSTVEEDVNFSVTYYDAADQVLATLNDTLRFRVPFEVEFAFFKSANNTGGEIEPYDDEFQYAVLKYAPAGGYSYTLDGFAGTKVLNFVGNLFPYYREVGDEADDVRVSDEVYLFARLDDGVATVTLYEEGTYALSTMSTKIYGGLSPLYEFGRPISNAQIPFRVAVAGDVDVQTEADASYNVFISAWEVYKWALVFSFGKIVLVLFVWGIIVVLLAYGVVALLPPDLRGQAFGAIAGTLVLVTSPLLIVAVRLLW